MNDRVSDERLGELLSDKSKTGFLSWAHWLMPKRYEDVVLPALRELERLLAQRCETCGNGAETLGPPFDSVGCNEHHGWWPKDGYCHEWKTPEKRDE